jgi:hypothetical protein
VKTRFVRAGSEYPHIDDPAPTENGNMTENIDGPSGGNVAVPPTLNIGPARNRLEYRVPFTVPEPPPISPPQNIEIGLDPAVQGKQTFDPPSEKPPTRENVSPSRRNRALPQSPDESAVTTPDVITTGSAATGCGSATDTIATSAAVYRWTLRT